MGGNFIQLEIKWFQRYSNKVLYKAECGVKHVICKNRVGKVFAWGLGNKGQLG